MSWKVSDITEALTNAFGASSKAACYSLSAKPVLLKNFLTALVNLSFHTGLSKNAVLKFVHLAILLLVNVVFSF